MHNQRETRGNIIEVKRCRDVIWGRNIVNATEGGEPWSEGEAGQMTKRERKKGRGAHRGSHKENISSKTLTGKMRGADYHEFL